MTRIPVLAFLTVLLAAQPSSAWFGDPPATVSAPNPGATPVDQLAISGNACGPAALLSAFRFGNPQWQQAADVPGDSDRARLSYIIRRHALIKSSHIPDRIRWHRSRGVNVADLTDIANEMAAPKLLPRVSSQLLFTSPREDATKLLRRTHSQLVRSLRHGLPPVASLRRYTRRQATPGNSLWLTLEGHFVVVTSVPGSLPKDARSFSFEYIDPWGGRHRTGTISVPAFSFQASAPVGDHRGVMVASPCLEANCPYTRVGLEKVRPGEFTVLAFEALIGRF